MTATLTPTRPTTRADHRTEVVPIAALDGTPLTLLHVRGRHEPTRGPVLLVHGAGVRAELFRPPTPRTVVDALIDDGWDVWLVNWRSSIDLEPVAWTMDEVAAYDHPAAVRAVCAATGADTVKAIVHCQGSTTFVMSVVAGLLPEVDTVVVNAVALHPVVPRLSLLKILAVAPVTGRLLPGISPAWGDKPAGPLTRAMVGLVRATHWECDNAVCRMVSFTYGGGWPALWTHEQLDETTHDWIRGEFGFVPFSFFDQMRRSVRAGQIVRVSPIESLPRAYAAQPPKTDARFALLAPELNRCFLPVSQQRSFDFLSPHCRASLHRIHDYGHLDVFLGKNAETDTFPLILEELRRP